MGMFDHVRYRMQCPKCGREVSNFQSKDGDCTLDILDTWQVSYFYSSCKCGAWIEFVRKVDPKESVEENFDMEVREQ